jgi:drug/metabolite transporter (DMT)-like permease
LSSTQRSGVLYAIVAAILFGASTPLAKDLLGTTSPLLLAGLLYCGSGVGLAAVLGVRALFASDRRGIDWPTRPEYRWLGAATLLGGIVAPPLLLYGLMTTPASSASLLLNLESVLTALLAWYLFRENFDRRIATGMGAIVVGGLVLAWTPGESIRVTNGAVLIAAACACWALDNNLTRKVSQRDPLVIAAVKGIVAGTVNLALGLRFGQTFPGMGVMASALVVGFAGYGVSLVLFVLALRHLGTARTGAYFAVAPFFGALYALLVQHETFTIQLGIAGVLMALGVWLHVSERHAHRHAHEMQAHAHPHVHDEHHRHAHDFAWDGTEPHAHDHVHEPIDHSHRHVPDIHHRHPH